MKLVDALDAASNDPFEEDGCAIYVAGGTGAVASFVVNRNLVNNQFCLVNIAPDTKWMVTPMTVSFFNVGGWEPLRLKDCQDSYLLDLLSKLG